MLLIVPAAPRGYNHLVPLFRIAFLAGLCSFLGALPSLAWSPQSQLAIARAAGRQAPSDLRRQIERNPKSYQRGVLEAFRSVPAAEHAKNPDGSGGLDRRLLVEVDAAIAAIRDHQPFHQVVYRLGIVSHFAADANNPLNTDGRDASEGRYYEDYLRYIDHSHPRFSLVLYADEPPVANPVDVKVMLARSLLRGRALYPLIGNEYRRIGFASGVGRFDDRSTAFGIAAVSFSHAISDVSQLLRYIWVEAGGSDAGSIVGHSSGGLVLLERSERVGKAR